MKTCAATSNTATGSVAVKAMVQMRHTPAGSVDALDAINRMTAP
jgi:hypothetical protein